MMNGTGAVANDAKKVRGDWDQAYLKVAMLSWLLRVRLGGGGVSITALTASKLRRNCAIRIRKVLLVG